MTADYYCGVHDNYWSGRKGCSECSKEAFALAKEWAQARNTDTQPTTDRIGSAAQRKAHPITSGVLDYFPDALLEVAHVSKVGNDQHNPGQPLHWAKEKSTDEADSLLRHLIDRGTRDGDGVRHSAKVAWRALALLQREIEADRSQQQQPSVQPPVAQGGQSLPEGTATP